MNGFDFNQRWVITQIGIGALALCIATTTVFAGSLADAKVAAEKNAAAVIKAAPYRMAVISSKSNANFTAINVEATRTINRVTTTYRWQFAVVVDTRKSTWSLAEPVLMSKR